jgi:CTP:molybdopterin cytidylyltransferase MocA
MTVAAVVLVRPGDDPLVEFQGQPLVRRLVDVGWAGGAIPVIVVVPDPDGAVGGALAGSAATRVDPAPVSLGPAGHVTGGMEAALDALAATTAAILWPARRAWVDPETITSLIEAHGREPLALLRPASGGVPGWPVLLPMSHLDTVRAVEPHHSPDEVLEQLEQRGVEVRALEVGDPGVLVDALETPAAPPYEGPPVPLSGPAPEPGAEDPGEEP